MQMGCPPKFKTPEELQARIDEYKVYLKENDKPPTIAGFAYYTGIDRKTVHNYRQKDNFFPIIKNFTDWILMNWEERGYDASNGTLVFMLKQYGYTDKQEIEQKIEQHTIVSKTPAQARKIIEAAKEKGLV